MTPRDIAKLSVITEPQLHPSSEGIAFTHTKIDLDKDRYVRAIWLHDDDRPRRFTAGPGDTYPRWSPDGTRLAFLRKGEGKQDNPQLAVISLTGGEAKVVTDFSLGVEALEWSPDGRRLVVVAITWTEDWEGLDDEQRARQPRRISAIPYRYDNKGWLNDRRRHLWLVDPDGGESPRCLTAGDFDDTAPAWHPSGERISFLSDRHPRRGLESGIDVYEVELASGETRQVAGRGSWVLPTYRPDGVLHLLGNPDPGYPVVYNVWRLGPVGALEQVAPHLDRSVVTLVGGLPTAQWVGDRLVTGLEDAGRLGVIALSPDGGIDHLVSGDRIVSGFSAVGEQVAFVATTAIDPGELYLGDPTGERRLTGFNDDLDIRLQPADHFQAESDGQLLDAWVYLPPGEERVPLLLNLHGGPATQYGFGFFDEFQVFAAAGYGVVACNPRGSAGRGREFVRAVVGEGWGTVDLADITAVVEEALRRFSRLDPDRMGIMGGSYGGFLTAWTCGHDRRYRSAVVERALLSYQSFVGTSDIGATFPRHYLGSSDKDVFWDKSPMAVARQIRTPTLIVHSEDDFRCPIEQAEQLFMALLDQGVPVEMLRFPGEGHELSRSGKPRHRVERFEAILAWHRRFL